LLLIDLLPISAVTLKCGAFVRTHHGAVFKSNHRFDYAHTYQNLYFKGLRNIFENLLKALEFEDRIANRNDPRFRISSVVPN
jgi:hypothetical protein